MSYIGKLLISETKLKNFTNINRNVDMDVLKAEIQIAQDIDVQTILGTRFYHHLLDQIFASGNTFNADELILVNDYIAPFLIQTAYFNAIPHLHYRSMNNGIVMGTQENATGVDLATMQYLRNVQKQRADFYMTRLQDYLLIGYGANQFPAYNTQSTKSGMIPDRAQKYNNGIFLRHTTRKGYSLKDVNKNSGANMYSELMNENPPCQDCY
jgi:hypothetical protein